MSGSSPTPKSGLEDPNPDILCPHCHSQTMQSWKTNLNCLADLNCSSAVRLFWCCRFGFSHSECLSSLRSSWCYVFTFFLLSVGEFPFMKWTQLHKLRVKHHSWRHNSSKTRSSLCGIWEQIWDPQPGIMQRVRHLRMFSLKQAVSSKSSGLRDPSCRRRGRKSVSVRVDGEY